MAKNSNDLSPKFQSMSKEGQKRKRRKKGICCQRKV
jgi:hypothetical protein